MRLKVILVSVVDSSFQIGTGFVTLHECVFEGSFLSDI